jgi:hypothetical protein
MSVLKHYQTRPSYEKHFLPFEMLQQSETFFGNFLNFFCPKPNLDNAKLSRFGLGQHVLV